MRGAWVEIGINSVDNIGKARRSPCGERGLKSYKVKIKSRHVTSLPVRGAWVEIVYADTDSCKYIVAPRAGSVG